MRPELTPSPIETCAHPELAHGLLVAGGVLVAVAAGIGIVRYGLRKLNVID